MEDGKVKAEEKKKDKAEGKQVNMVEEEEDAKRDKGEDKRDNTDEVKGADEGGDKGGKKGYKDDKLEDNGETEEEEKEEADVSKRYAYISATPLLSSLRPAGHSARFASPL